ncbi:MAG: hypothetical protein IBX71_06930 [Candidatus Desulforudis sp.]|nr:hypothetical protein [Desulforudis sp.]
MGKYILEAVPFWAVHAVFAGIGIGVALIASTTLSILVSLAYFAAFAMLSRMQDPGLARGFVRGMVVVTPMLVILAAARLHILLNPMDGIGYGLLMYPVILPFPVWLNDCQAIIPFQTGVFLVPAAAWAGIIAGAGAGRRETTPLTVKFRCPYR